MAGSSAQPNILFVMADRLVPHFTGAYEHPVVRTPARRALVEREVRFVTGSPIREQMLVPQRARRVVHTATETGHLRSWDFSPSSDTTNQHIRNHMDWPDAGSRTRYPPVA